MLFWANQTLRFLLEIAALVAAAYWGFAALPGWPLRILAGIGLPVAMAAAWGVFRIPNDGGAPVVEVAPLVRLALEVAFFALATGLLWAVGRGGVALVLLALIVVTYAIDHRRTRALLANRLPAPR